MDKLKLQIYLVETHSLVQNDENTELISLCHILNIRC